MNTIDLPESVAIIGMAGRFPQAANLEEFWRNLRAGREAITFFEPEEAERLHLEHPPGRDNPRFVRARAVLERAEWFDPAFFQLNPREAALMDPQQRVFLECAWEALEDAGCNPETCDGAIGVFAGSGFNTYLFNNLLTHRDLIADFGLFPVLTMNDKDYLATRVAYKFGLRGPGINVQTACSTSLVAVCLACQNLLGWHCDVALAGGVSIAFPTNRGHQHVEGGIMSQDGHCRPFDAKATGTVTGSGAGVVVLKRLTDAIAAGDRICAVIKGNAINNDGHEKMGFTAPSIDGQAECIATAQAMAGFDPASISYIEAHGTGTPLGDPIEMAALAKAFGAAGGQRGTCAVASLKSNLGHLDVAAGIAGLIKTTLALQHGEIPPSLHFETPNPEIDFANGPFFINDRLRPWPRGATPRRAGVSSFGIGGTNAHVVLEEAPALESAPAAREPQLLVLSAGTHAALEAATDRLADHLGRPAAAKLADVAFTLQVGRKRFPHRRILVAENAAGAAAALRTRDRRRVTDGTGPGGEPRVVFMFPGQGSQAINMARGLDTTEPAFRTEVDQACEILRPRLGLDLRGILFPGGSDVEAAEASRLLRQTRLTQPALFVIEHALARMWMRWGIRPAAMLGHSLGEYIAACLAGVFTLEDALAIVAQRAALMQAQPAGAMLAVRLPAERMLEWIRGPLALAAINAPSLSIASGPFDAIEALERRLAETGIASKRLATSHAFHSPMMQPAMAPLAACLRGITLRPPQLPWVSNLTGTWIQPVQATNPAYWADQMRHTVRFAAGVEAVAHGGRRVLLEVGPGRTLADLARQHPAATANALTVLTTFGAAGTSESAGMLEALGRLWIAGAEPDWRHGVHAAEHRRIVALPTYPFERIRCWIEPGSAWPTAPAPSAAAPLPPAAAAAEVAATPETAAPPPPAPVSPAALVKQIFQDLSGLDLSRTPAGQTFHQLGFDSLFLSQAGVAVGRRFGVPIAARQLRDELATFEDLARHVERQARTGGAGTPPRPPAPAPDPVPLVSEHRIPLTEAQREIWMVCQLGAAAAAAYSEAATMRLDGALDRDALQRAVGRLVARHEALNATFSPGGDVQIIAPRPPAGMICRDCPESAPEGPEGSAAGPAARFIAQELARPFDLTTGPLFRPLLARLDSRRHVLALVVHHIVCDGWSLGILVRELAELYAAEVASAPLALPAAPRLSACAAERENEDWEQTCAAAAAYWEEHFADAVPLLDLPTDLPRGARRTYAGDFASAQLPGDVTDAVRRIGAQSGTTAFTLLLAVFNLMMHRLSGQDDLVIGVPSAAQALDGHPDLVGHFANLLPIRSRLRDDQRFSDYLAEVRRTLGDALAHGRYPFVRLLQQLKLPRDASRVPLTPVLFNTTHHQGTVAFGDVTATLTVQPKRFVNFDLTFNVARTGDTLSLGCQYSTELYEAATIARWLQHFQTLLRAITADPDIHVGALSLLTEADRDLLLRRWNETTLEYDRTACVHQLFEEQVRRQPDAIAVVAGSERLSYQELNTRADMVAAQLRSLGVKPDVPVGLLLGRTPHLLTAMLGVLKAGGAYVPLDPAHPPQRRAHIMADTQMPVVVTEHAGLHLLRSGTRILLIDDPHPTATGPLGPAAAVDPENLAYILHTSGSTGRPKGVCVPHRGIVALAAWARRQYRPGDLAGVLFATPVTFDVAVFESLIPLCLGGRVILAGHLLQLGYLPGAQEVTLVSGVPSAIAELVRSRHLPGSVRTVNVAGEPCPQSLVESLYALPHVERVFDLYGPTETTVYSTASLRRPGGRATIGRPLPNEQVYLLDRRQQPVPIGVPGELYLGGDKLARGYLNRPELTAEKFVELPLLPGRRLYRTGDLARYRPDGTIEFLGRLDHQVKIRGYRIELGEIESALREHPQVREAVAVARTGPGGAQHLAGYVVPAAGAPLTPADLTAHLQQWLPVPMVPAFLQVLPELPRTTSGKVDRNALPAPHFESATQAPTPARTEVEEILCEFWRDVLGVPTLGVHDNFFALGGHSLHAMQVIARINQALGIEFTLGDFFVAPTVAGIAPVIEAALLAEAEPGDATQRSSPSSAVNLRSAETGFGSGRPESAE